MAHSAPAQPDWSGLQVNEADGPARSQHAAEDSHKIVDDSQPIDYFANGSKHGHDAAETPGFDQKIVDDPVRTPLVGGDGKVLGVSDEKQVMGEGKRGGLLPRTKKGRRRCWILVAAIALIVAIVIAVPCGVLLSQKSSSSSSQSGSDSQPDSNTTNTAFNGTKIAGFQPPASPGELWIYWQSSTGDVRMSQMDSSGKWANSTSMNITNAVPGTGLAVCAHTWDDGSSKGRILNHLVFETTDGYYSDLINDPTQGASWRDGGLNAQKRGTPTGSPRINEAWATYENGTGFYYTGGSSSGFWNEWTYDATSTAWWNTVFVFDNTTAYSGGVAQQSDNQTILHVVSRKNEIVSWYRDVTQGAYSWTRNGDAVQGIFPNTSLAGTHENGDMTKVWYQDSSSHVSLAKLSGTNSSSTWISQSQTSLRPLDGSSLLAEALITDGTTTTHMFFQQSGDDITHYTSSNGGYNFNFVETVPL